MRYTLTILVACVATLALAGGGHNTEQTAATGAVVGGAAVSKAEQAK